MTTKNVVLPAFDPADPGLWFQVVDAIFNQNGVTEEEQKYFSVLVAILPVHIKEVRDVVIAPISDQSFSRLKGELTKWLGTSQKEKTQQLLEKEIMGDEKPSQILRRLQGLAGQMIPEEVVRSLWTRRLPPALQPIMATQRDKNLAEAAELVDAVLTSTTGNFKNRQTNMLHES